MPIQLSQKERMLLEDLKHHEQLCIQKYTKYSNEAQDQQLKQIFQNLSTTEQEHFNTVNQILSGQVPNMNQGQQAQGQQQQQNPMQQQPVQAQGQKGYNQNDADITSDMLSTEKYVSSTYNTAIFEFQDAGVRQALNHIQKEEQEHGEQLFNYMKTNGMYKIQ